MTRTRRSVSGALVAVVAVGLLLSTPGLGAAEPAPAGPNDIATLIAAVADANQQLQDIGASVQSRQEAVNKAIVDVQTARDQAEAAKVDVAASHRAVEDANAAISAAQQRFDTYAATAYINGPSASYLTSTTPEEFIATASAGETLAISAKQTLNDL
ncbi:MAG: peptidase M23, partial [Mycobacterium sp.]